MIIQALQVFGRAFLIFEGFYYGKSFTYGQDRFGIYDRLR